MSKLTENSFRDVNIAFANELSILCDKFEINPWELIALANRHPRVNILQPGVGVGGHCIAVDPWFIVHKGGDDAKIIRTAREVNSYKTEWSIEKIKNAALNFEKENGRSAKVACMGLAFKPDIDDLRESPALHVTRRLKADGVDVNCEVSLFHLTHSDEACRGFNTISKIMPPLAVEEDREKLLNALKNSEIDQLTTLHRAYSPIYKEVAFFDAEYGSEMIADALVLYYTKLVKSEIISMSKLVELTVKKPAELSGFECGKIYEGKKGTFLLFDREYESRVENPMSLYHGEKLFGKIVKTL